MGNCYSADHLAEDRIHTDKNITLRNHNRSSALKQSVIDYWGLKHVLPDPYTRP